MYETMNLSHAEALEMIGAVRTAAEAGGKAVCVAVTDSHGELIAFLRMDGCHLPPLQIAINKAFTAARERRPSGEVGRSSRTAPFPMTNFGDPRYTGWGGGLPILHKERVVGAIGVSGLDEDQDTALAKAGADLFR